MNIYIRILFIVFCLCFSLESMAQHIASLKITPSKGGLGIPVIELNSYDKLRIDFDDISEQGYSFAYRIIHCNADYSPSNMRPIEYLIGRDYNDIHNIELSFNSRVNYTHYSFEFPNVLQKPKISGNFKIEIYEMSDADKILADIYFYVCETKVSIKADVIAPHRVEYRRSKQELKIEVEPNPNAIKIINAQQNLKLFVQQNLNINTRIRIPISYISGNKYEFRDNTLLVFDGLNEFRNVDTRSLNYASRNVESLEIVNNIWNIIMYEDKPKQYTEYSDNDDINGDFIIKANNYSNSNIEADYSFVHFYLKSNILDGDIHILGSFNSWTKSKDNKMEFNADLGLYTLTLPLKQGFYDYTYVISKDGIDNYTDLEGNFQETKNDYYIYVYYRDAGGRYDRLIGIRRVNSIEESSKY